MKDANWRENIKPASQEFYDWIEVRGGFPPGFVQAKTRNCLLCGNPSVVFGMFEPGDIKTSEMFGAHPGKHRVFFYGLCDKCADPADAVDRVEAFIFLKCGKSPAAAIQ